MRVLFILACVGSVANAYRAHDLVADGQITEDSLQKLQRTLSRLNSIQKQIFFGRSNTSEEASESEIQFDQEFDGKPDELPYLFEGDILLTDEQMDKLVENAEDQLWAAKGKANPRKKRSLTSDLRARWQMPIPYYIDTRVDARAVQNGINKWQEETCVTFKQLYSPYFDRHGLKFVYGQGCSSYVGVIPSGYNNQPVSIGYGCNHLGTVTHEIAHALGAHHEQGRYDRDSYIRVLEGNILSDHFFNFQKQQRSEMEDYGVGYDFGSVMHYGTDGFTSNGRATMQAHDGNYQQTFGQRNEPSFSDIKRMNLAYCKASCPTELNCVNGGYTDPKNCAKCRCPDGFGGTLCDRAADAQPACLVSELTATRDFQTISAQWGATCPYIITAPPGRKVYFEVTGLQFSRPYPYACSLDFLEIKYKEDVVATGARFCNKYPEIRLSEGNRLVVIYKGSQFTRFSMRFRQDPNSPGEHLTPPPTTTYRPVPTVPSTTTSPIRPTTLFPFTTRPITYCSAWSQCTARCGGCGTRTRRCNGKYETFYCNTNPCQGGFCCKPFFYVRQGLCVFPYGDPQVIADAKMETSEEKEK